mgnify:CR=1 FL=1
MDFAAILTEHFTLVVMVACLVVGYIIKHATFLNRIPNNDIPAILAVFGGVLNCAVAGVSVDAIVYGAFMGLASTGFHQLFKAFVEGKKNTAEIE